MKNEIELEEYAKLDGIIKSGAKTFMAVGRALVQMHEGKLYLKEFKTFEEYTASRGIKRQAAYRLMTAVQMSMELSDVSHADTNGTRINKGDVEKSSANALNALATVPRSKRREVFGKAAEKSGGAPTEMEIIEVAAQVTHKAAPTQPEPVEQSVDSEMKALEDIKPIPHTDFIVPAEPEPLTPNAPLADGKPMTLIRFMDDCIALFKRVPSDLELVERQKYGVKANDILVKPLMNPAKKTSNPYTR